MVVQILEVLCYLLCRLDIICITALLFSTTLCNYPVLSFQEYGKRTNIHCKHISCCIRKTIYLSSTFTDSIFILSKLRQNIADIRGFMMDYDNKMLFL